MPSLDGVAFIDPKNSQVDIIQAVGRAIRLSEGKSVGTIVLPVFIKDGEDPVTRIEESNFQPVWWVLDALKAHDDVLVDELDSIRIGLGRDPDRPVRPGGISKVEVDLPASVGAYFANSLTTYLVEHTTASWNFWFGMLEGYAKKTGHCNVNSLHKEGTYNLGNWVHSQRVGSNTVTPERRQRLDEIGFDWDPYTTDWEIGFAALMTFKGREGHCRVLRSHKEGKYNLAQWVTNLRAREERVSLEQRQRLDDIGFDWDPIKTMWEIGFSALLTFKGREGHCRVLRGHKEGTCKLGNWITHQRQKKDTITPDQRQRLDEIGFDMDPNTTDWETMYKKLVAFKIEHNNCDVRQSYKIDPKLGKRVSQQRTKYSKDKLEAIKISRLTDLGFIWKIK